MKKLFLIIMAALLVFSGQVFAAQSLTSGDQTIYGKKTFEHEATFKKNLRVLGAILGFNQFSNVYYVDSGSGADTMGNNRGTSWDNAFATIEYALAQCTADQGDVIVLVPGHNEAVSTAGAIDLDIAGIYVIGMGSGTDMPTIDFDADVGSVTVGADNITIENVRFRVSANSTNVGLDIEDGVSYVTVRGCQFGFAETATDEFDISLRTGDASNYITIENCLFAGGAQAAVDAILFNKDTDHTIIRNNYFTGTYSTAVITGAATASTNLLITNNHFYTGGTADTFNLVAASTGILSRNIITMNAVSAAAAMDVGNLVVFDNWLIADDDVTGAAAAIRDNAFASVTATADD